MKRATASGPLVLLALLVLSAPQTSAASDALLPEAARVVLENGAVLVLVQKPEVPLVGVRAILDGGAISDPPGKAGTANLLAGLLTRGAGNRDAAAFAETVEAVGGSLSADAALESIVLSGEFLARDAGLMIELLGDMLQGPRLDSAEFDKLRAREIDFIRAAKDADPGDLVPLYANAFVYGDHPYGNPVSGSEESLAAITHTDIVDYHERYLGGDRLIVVLAGDFDAAEMEQQLRAALSDWRPAAQAPVPAPAPQAPDAGRVLLVDKPGATQTYFWIGSLGVPRRYPQHAALELANTLFGGRFTSMLNSALRVESGLTYGASSKLTQPRNAGTVAISSYTQTEATREAIDMALGVLGRLHDAPIAPEMLESAQNYVLGQFPTELETAAQLAGQFAMLEFYGLDRGYIDDYGDEIREVTIDALAPVIAEVYPSRDELLFVLIGDADSIREVAAGYGDVTEIPITAPRFHVIPAEPQSQK